MKRLNKAIVAIGMGTASDSLDYVSHNDFQAGQVLADYLIDRGCVEIGFFSGSRHSECFTARLNGVVVQALHRLGEKSFSCRYADSSRQQGCDGDAGGVAGFGEVSPDAGFFCISWPPMCSTTFWCTAV